MMVVYLVLEQIPHEHTNIIGVYSQKHVAQACAKARADSQPSYIRDLRYVVQPRQVITLTTPYVSGK